MKYVYNENLITNAALTGEATPLTKGSAVAARHRSRNAMTRAAFYTERHLAMALHAAVTQYLVSGTATDRAYFTAGLGEIVLMQDQPTFMARAGDTASRTGCLHYYAEESDEPGELASSPWMSALLSNALARAYLATGDSRVPAIMSDLAKCIVARGLYTKTVGGQTYRVPYYLAAANGAPHSPPPDPMEAFGADDEAHALDVGYLVALGAYLTTDPTTKASLEAAARDLLRTHQSLGVGLSTPPRQHNWWFKNGYAIDWLLNGKAASPVQ